MSETLDSLNAMIDRDGVGSRQRFVALEAVAEIESLTAQRDALLAQCMIAVKAFDDSYANGRATWKGKDVDAMRAAIALCPAPPCDSAASQAVETEPSLEQMRNEVMFCGPEGALDNMPPDQVRWYWRQQQSVLRKSRQATPPCDSAAESAERKP